MMRAGFFSKSLTPPEKTCKELIYHLYSICKKCAIGCLIGHNVYFGGLAVHARFIATKFHYGVFKLLLNCALLVSMVYIF